jgi:hypothetical protein
MQEWSPAATSRYQDHVIAHVEGATALGYFVIDDAAYVLLDIALILTVYCSGEMALMPQAVVVKDLQAPEDLKAELLSDIERLHRGEREGLARTTFAPAGCLILEVRLYARGERRRIMLEGEEASLVVEGSLDTGEIRVREIIVSG